MAVNLEMVERLRAELTFSLNSLGGKVPSGILDNYRFYSAFHINTTARGYLELRRIGHDYAARHLVRPLLETNFRLTAIKHDPHCFFRIICGEVEEDRKWLRAMNEAQFIANDDNKRFDDSIAAFTAQYSKEFPDHPTDITAKLNMVDLAAKALLSGPYNTHYRLYCRHTHGNVSAMTGLHSEIHANEELTVAVCLLVGIDELIEMGAESEDVESIKDELIEELSLMSGEGETVP